VMLKSEVGIARVVARAKGYGDVEDDEVSAATPVKMLRYSRKELEETFGGPGTPVEIEVTAMNGKQSTVKNVWSLFNGRSYMQVPGTDIRLLKQSFSSFNLQDEDADRHWEWAVMLRKRDAESNLVDASKVDLRVGGGLDGAIVYYEDGTGIPCGQRYDNGADLDMGGHQAKKLALPKGVEIAKVAVTRKGGNLCGLRMWLENGKGRGALNFTPAETELKMLGTSTCPSSG